MTEGSHWELVDFLRRLDRWAELEQPDDELRRLVTAWILTRFDEPYQGVRREPGFDNLWFGRVPGSEVGGTVVTCAYWIEEDRKVVRCDSFATLSLPL